MGQHRKYPLFYAFGDHHEFLSNEEAIEATRDARLRSIWPFLIKRVIRFQETLSTRERGSFDPEDTCSDLVVALLQKDADWNPERGKYVTYAASIIEHHLASIRDSARTVASPRNSTGRLKEYGALEEAGTISPQRSKTASDIRRTIHGIQGFSTGPHSGNQPCMSSQPEPADLVADAEEAGQTEATLRAAIATMPALEAGIIARLTGLRNGPLAGPQSASLDRIAWEEQIAPADFRAARTRAIASLRQYIESRKRPKE